MTRPALNFTTNSYDMTVIRKIAERAGRLMQDLEGIRDNAKSRIDTEMDLSATHASGCPIRLDDLLAADDFNFLHDVLGIRRHLNRKTGRLGDCFMPRFARIPFRAAGGEANTDAESA